MLSNLLNKMGITDAPTAEQETAIKLVAQYAREYLADVGQYGVDPKKYEAGRAILALPREGQAAVAVLACQRVNELVGTWNVTRFVTGDDKSYREARLFSCLAGDLLKRKLPLTERQTCALLDALSGGSWFDWVPAAGCTKAAENYVKSHGLTDAVRASIDGAIERLSEITYTAADQRKIVNRLRAIRDSISELPSLQLTRSERWSAAVLDFVTNESTERRNEWSKLLAHAATATSSKPSKKWLGQARQRIDEVTPTDFRKRFLEWVMAAETGGRNERPVLPLIVTIEPRDEHLFMDSTNAQTLKGLLWMATLLDDDMEVVRAVGRLSAACYRKIAGHGARSTAVANACVWALGAIPGKEAVAQLSFVRTKSKYQAAKQGVEKALQAAAEREGVSRDDLEEMAVPTLGLSEVGRRAEQLGDYRAELVVIDTHTAELRWCTAGGKPQKSVPAVLKRDFAANLKELKAAQKELQRLLPAQRSRIESCFLRRTPWIYSAWRERYLDHPLVGTLARRLIWSFRRAGDVQSTGIWHEGSIVDASGNALEGITVESQVELWHPARASAEEVLAWRQWLEQHNVTQPFKQAHREIYLLTDAERNMETYSNRFAAHILRQHQFAALCTERGWRYRLQGAWDSANTPTIDLPQWEMRVEFWVDPVEHEQQSGMGIFNYLSTDQVRFYSMGQDGPMRLTEVPPLVFSEMMRDVDLFVGVSSVGNDPNWGDGGTDGRYATYWQGVSFGDLSATAKTRREVLAALVPRLKIADRCSLDEKFLIVRGELRTYKIHLGSGNILMMPNDAYLCIVPGQRGAAKVSGKLYLPFEGDTTLSIIISKALLLADDAKITDPTIVNQIRCR